MRSDRRKKMIAVLMVGSFFWGLASETAVHAAGNQPPKRRSSKWSGPASSSVSPEETEKISEEAEMIPQESTPEEIDGRSPDDETATDRVDSAERSAREPRPSTAQPSGPKRPATRLTVSEYQFLIGLGRAISTDSLPTTNRIYRIIEYLKTTPFLQADDYDFLMRIASKIKNEEISDGIRKIAEQHHAA